MLLLELTVSDKSRSGKAFFSLMVIDLIKDAPPQEEKYQQELEQIKKEWRVDIDSKIQKSEKKEIKNQKPPNPFLKEISQTASLVFKFESEVQIVPDFKILTDATILVSDLHNRRTLKDRRASINTERVPVLQLKLIPGNEENDLDLSFTWNITE